MSSPPTRTTDAGALPSTARHTRGVGGRGTRVTLVIAGLGRGGAERVCVNLANAWAAGGRRVTLLTTSQGGVAPAYELDPRVERRDLGWWRAPRGGEVDEAAVTQVARGLVRDGCLELAEEVIRISLLRVAILATEPGAVVSHIDLTNLRVLAALAGTRVPVFACEHTDTTMVGLGRLQRVRATLYRRASAVVAPHTSSAEWLARDGARAVAIPNPLVTPPASALSRAGRARGPRRLLLTLARLSPEKRVGLLVDAFARIAGEFPEWDLDIYGDGPERDSLRRLVADAGLGGRVRLRGFAADPYAALARADLFASASWVEGFGNAVWEALACGVPVVATECGEAVRALVRDGVDGLIVGGDGAPPLAAALASLMRDGAARATCAARAREVVGRFNIARSLRAWDELLDGAG
jgi:glycosyltransferase involved in cell wall biosynthesis